MRVRTRTCYLASVLWMMTAVAAQTAPWTIPSPSPSLLGYPGVHSREYVQSVVEQEMRKQISRWSKTAARTTKTKQKMPQNRLGKRSESKLEGSILRRGHRDRYLKKNSDFSGLNDILETFIFDIPEEVIEQQFLGATATITISGECKNIQVRSIGLDYDSKGDDLTYKIEIENLDVDCIIDIKFDFGVYDVEDDVEIEVKFVDNDFAIGVVLEGKPPESSSFKGCQADISIKEIDADGGFSANILNDLDDQLVDLVEQEKPIISQLLCEQLAQFTSVVDGVLMTLSESIEPYLGRPKSADPLKMEKHLRVEEELVDFTNSDLGYAIQVITTNLDGVFGPYQVNTLIELNLLDEDGIYTLDLSEEEEESEDNRERNSASKDDSKSDSDSDSDSEDDWRRSLQAEECSLIRRQRRILGALLGEDLVGRQLQFDEELFTLNSLDIQTIEVAGLNTFNDVDPVLEIIGRHTFRTKLEVSHIEVKATLRLNADINEETIEETIEVTVPIEDIDITVSYLVGLSAAAVEEIKLANLLSDNISDCLLSTLRVAGLSELDVSVGEIGSPTVEGVLSSGVDELVNTAIEAAIYHYQELIVKEAIPNIAQKNLTVQFNEYAECYIRTEAVNLICPEPEQPEDGNIITGLFDFRRLAGRFFD